MQLLYEASNSIEAHMVLNLLQQAGLSARIDGELLQGGMGELQAIGLVRVMVEPADHSEAKLIVDEWDRKQPEQEITSSARKTSSSIGVAVVGFLFGVIAMAFYFRTPITYDGIDYNGDGKLDEKWTYMNDLISRAEADRNLDGEVDIIYSYDRRGLLESSSSDNNFNGVFETEIYYENGNAIWQKSDTTGDGFTDYKTNFRHGIIETISFIEPATKNIIKIQEFGPFKLQRVRLDSNGDGIMDTVYEYDATEEIFRESR